MLVHRINFTFVEDPLSRLQVNLYSDVVLPAGLFPLQMELYLDVLLPAEYQPHVVLPVELHHLHYPPHLRIAAVLPHQSPLAGYLQHLADHLPALGVAHIRPMAHHLPTNFPYQQPLALVLARHTHWSLVLSVP